MKTVVLKIKGLTEKEIQEALTVLFSRLSEKHPTEFGAGVSIMRDGSEGEKTILEIAKL